MGANPTQAQGLVLFLIAFVLIAAGFAAAINYLLVILGIALLAASAALFIKCKPWEQEQE
jgi:hypothetical protein